MGSGGPRGLQILLSGADRVRGGFDSHTFPPVFRSLILGCLLVATALRPALAQEPGPDAPLADAGIVAVDSVAANDAGPGTAPATAKFVSPRGRDGALSSPRWIMWRSAVVPGWGQAYNGHWLKAGAIGVVEFGLAYRILDDGRALDDLDREAAAALAAGNPVLQNDLALRYNDRLDRMVARQWLLAGVIVYSLLDAYVDAHFRNFEIDFKTDPALPGEDHESLSGRAGLRWSF